MRRDSLVELSVFYGLVFVTLWGGQWVGVRPPGPLAGLLIVGFCAWSARRHGDGREKLGLDWRWLGTSARLTARWLGLPLLGLLVWALKPPLPGVERLLFGVRGVPPALQDAPAAVVVCLGILRYPLWASAQEFALLSFLSNRWRDVFPERPWTVSLVNGTLFSLVHAPNPVLMTACLIGGAAFTRLFLKAPHLLPLALAHGATGLLLSVIFRDFPPAMMVGPAYLTAARGLFGPG